jgi:hypothetical protein
METNIDNSKIENKIECQNHHNENITVVYNTNNLVKKYTNHIKSMKKLDNEMLNNIFNMNNADKMEIILVLNDMVERIKRMIE